MIIAAIVISVLSVALSAYSFTVSYRWSRRSRELRKNYLEARAKNPHPLVLDFSHGGDALLAATREAIKKRPQE